MNIFIILNQTFVSRLTVCFLFCFVLSGCVTTRLITQDNSRPLRPDPPSTLLPAWTTRLGLVLESLVPTACRYALKESTSFTGMAPFDLGQGTTHHVTMLRDLSSDPKMTNRVYVRCEAYPELELELLYRSLPVVNPPFPRTGNLWGSWNLIHRGLEYCARIDLWLGSHWRPDELRELRRLNPHVVALTAINAVDSRAELPSDFFLKDIHGKRIEVWPGEYRLNLTKPTVAEFQAQSAYEQLLKSDLMYDGLFIDNVFLTQAWQKQDIHGHPIQIDADEDGVADDPAELDAAWRAGVLRELRSIRSLLPYAMFSGHGVDIEDSEIATLFNATSIGFEAPFVIENRIRFAELWERYASWQGRARPPVGSMIESAVPLQIGYGYGYVPFDAMPPSTREFARQYYPYMRFGLAVALMHDGYFTHELGDTFHGNDWWYDELDFDLGYPLGPAKPVRVGVASWWKPEVFRREFTNGLALLNASRDKQTVTVGPGFQRLTGSQAALHEYIVDDTGVAFSTSGDWKDVVYDSGEWKAAGPYFHDWGPGSHEGRDGTARWNLQIPEADIYTITAWWPAAPSASAWNGGATYEIVSDGTVVASATFDQRSGGDEWHLVGRVPLRPGASVRLRCDARAPCLADALHVRSQRRYNDGSLAETVTLQPMDGIVLKRRMP